MPRQLSESDRRNLRRRLLRGVRGLLQGDPGNTLSGQPVEDFLAGPRPATPLPAWLHDSGRAACDRWARGDRGLFLPGRDLYYRQLCEPYLGDGMPGPSSTTESTPPGQCVGIAYRADFFTTIWNDISRPGVNNNVIGPVRVLFLSPGGGVNLRGDFTYENVVLEYGPGNTREVITGSVFGSRLDSITFTRLDSLPDDCGDPITEFDPGDPNPTDDPNPGPVGGPAGYGYPGFDIGINPDGSISVDFGDGSDPVTIDPGAGVDRGPEPGDLGEPGSTSSTGSGGDTEGEAPDGQVLVGLKLGILSTPPQAKEYQEGFYRGAVYIFMGAVDGLDMDFAGSIVRNNQFVLAEKDNLTKWFVAANPGYNFAVTPYYREAE